MDTLKKLVSVIFFFGLTKILDPQNFSYASESGQTSESWEKLKLKRSLGRCQQPHVEIFFKTSFKNKNKIENAHR